MWGPSSPVGPCLLFLSMKATRVTGPRVQERIFNLPESRVVEIVTVFSWMLRDAKFNYLENTEASQ